MLRRAPSIVALLVVALAALLFAYYGGLFGARGPTPRPLPSRSPSLTASPAQTTPPSVRPSGQPSASATDPLPPRPSNTPLDTSVSAAAIVVPTRSADLAMSITGIVRNVYVRENDEVRVGQVLLRLDQSGYLAEVAVSESAVTRGEAAVDRATVALEQLPDDATPGQIETANAELRLAEADLELARSTLAEAQAALRATELRSPIAGTVAALNVTNGEIAFAGNTLMTVGDMAAWLIETTNLSELEVVRIAPGDRATITFAALPAIVLTGRVDRIQVRGTTDSGEVKFAVVIRPDIHLDQLRWNMSATVRIEPSG
jgi:HlyD family secretion protein